MSRASLRCWAVALSLSVGCFDAELGAESSTPSSDGASRDDGDDAHGDASVDEVSSVQHPACPAPLRSDEPPAEDDYVEPDAPNKEDAFEEWANAWVGSNCTVVDMPPRCGPGNPCGYGSTCLFTDEGDAGYCARYPEYSVALSYRDGACRSSVDPEVKRALCCAKVPGVDCRVWPYATASQFGELCDGHDDCEPGLRCKANQMCGCPGPLPAAVARPDCGMDYDGEWGAASPVRVLGSCAPTASASFVEEALFAAHSAEEAGVDRIGRADFRLQVTYDRSAQFFVTFTTRAGLTALTDGAPDWPGVTSTQTEFGLHRLELPVLEGGQAPEVFAFGPDDSVHVAYDTLRENLLLRRLVDGVWDESSVKNAGSGFGYGLGVDSSGARHVATGGPNGGLTYFEERAGTFARSAFEQPGTTWSSTDLTRVIVRPDDSVVAAHFGSTDPSGWITELATGSVTHIDGLRDVALAADGTLWALAHTYDQLRMELHRFDVHGEHTHEVIWRCTTWGCAQSEPTLAIGPNGPLVVHRSPFGMSLTRKDVDGWHTEPLTGQRGPGRIVMGADGKAQIYFWADVDGDGNPEQLRRLREGSCAN